MVCYQLIQLTENFTMRYEGKKIGDCLTSGIVELTTFVTYLEVGMYPIFQRWNSCEVSDGRFMAPLFCC